VKEGKRGEGEFWRSEGLWKEGTPLLRRKLKLEEVHL
jgi:hypothetical protein